MSAEPFDFARPSPPRWLNHILNTLISALLRSPLHGLLSGSTLIISFSGRKSGKAYTFPVGYYRLEGDTLLLIPLHNWWTNLQGGVPISIWLKGRQYAAIADARQSDEVTIRELEGIIRDSANLLRVYGIQRDANSQPEAEQVRRLAAALPLVHVRLGQ